MFNTPVITTRLNALLAALVLAAAAALAAGGAGYALGHRLAKADGDAALARLERDHATLETRAAETALARLQEAQARGDALVDRLAAEEASRQTQAQEHAREIKRLTTGRPCLNAGTVRLLNEPAIGFRASTLPASAGGTAAADAAAASDTDVAGWIDNARHQYDACRSRLDALIDWH
ncbi:MAG TPA: hypothetical protein VJ603_00825 [Paucimonas sp.]|nr:hypothetical protein [Paucimonas sp.]